MWAWGRIFRGQHWPTFRGSNLVTTSYLLMGRNPPLQLILHAPDSLFSPDRLQGSIVQEDDALLPDDLLRLLRRQEVVIRLADMIAARL